MFERLGVIALAAFLLVACGGGTVQEPPLTPSRDEVEAHSIRLIEPVRRPTHDRFNGPGVVVSLSVSETGEVIDAAPVPYSGTERPPSADVVAEAVANARAATFEPFMRDGVTRPARVEVDVLLLAPERPLKRRVPFPATAGQEVVIRLERTQCYGRCPAYTVEVRGDGQVTFTGESHVALTGVHRRRISPQAVQGLLTLFREADFFSLDDSYFALITDMPRQTVTLTVGGRTRTVHDYAGLLEGMPFGVKRLEHAIDRVAGVRTWIDGDAGTAEGLEAEGYDFTTPAAGQALIRMAWDGSEDAAIDFVARGAPLAAKADEGPGLSNRGSALEGSATMGRARLLRALIDRGALEAPNAAEMILTAAARSRDRATLEIALGTARFDRRQLGRALTAALNEARYNARGLDPTPVAERLLALNADVTVADDEGRTALHGATSAAMVRRLRALGADIEARDRYGSTPVLSSYDEDVILALLEAGADPTVKPEYGETLRVKAEQNRWTRVLARLRT